MRRKNFEIVVAIVGVMGSFDHRLAVIAGLISLIEVLLS
jgi:hypothetical protein